MTRIGTRILSLFHLRYPRNPRLNLLPPKDFCRFLIETPKLKRIIYMGKFLFLSETSEPCREHGLRALPTAFLSLGRFRGLFVTEEQKFRRPRQPHVENSEWLHGR